MKANQGRKQTQLPLPLKGPHGGRRKGAGRKNLSGKQGHSRRAKLDPRVPVHVTLKLAPGLPNLRNKDMFRMLRAAVKTARKKGFAVAHFAILSNHVHLLIEPEKSGLSPQIQSFCISFARRLNHALGRMGAIFQDRYHVRALRTPREVRNALSYVLTNQARHEQRNLGTRSRLPRLEVRLDPFSSALAFSDWRALLGRSVQFFATAWSDEAIESWHQEILSTPKTWLLKAGWKRASA